MSWHQHCTRFSVCTKCNKWNRIDWHKCRNCGERYTLRAPTEEEKQQYKQMTDETQVGTMRYIRSVRRMASMKKTAVAFKTTERDERYLTTNQFLALLGK